MYSSKCWNEYAAFVKSDSFVKCEIATMTTAQQLSLAFGSMDVTNEPLALGMLNLVRRQIIIAPTQCVYCRVVGGGGA
jgi:hypothetical protein